MSTQFRAEDKGNGHIEITPFNPANGILFAIVGIVLIAILYVIGAAISGVYNLMVTDVVDGVEYTIAKDSNNNKYYYVSDLVDSKLTEVTILSEHKGKPVKAIGEEAFSASSLTKVVIPDSITEIGNDAFSGTSLTHVTIPNSVTHIGDYAFRLCPSLSSVKIGSGVNSMGTGVFLNCSALTDVIISNGVKVIGKSAFESCTSLKNVSIPKSVLSIEEFAFIYCNSLTNIVIPDGVVRIERMAFWSCKNLTKIIIPDTVTYIGHDTFNQCYNVTVYCEVDSKPDGWSDEWDNKTDYTKINVVWNYSE